MAHPELRLAILSEMANIRRELIKLQDSSNPLGPIDFVSHYKAHLEQRLEQLEQALKDHEEAAD